MSEYSDFLKEFDNFYVPRQGVEFYESALEDGLIQISDWIEGKLSRLITTYKLADLKRKFEDKERGLMEAYKKAKTTEEKAKIFLDLRNDGDKRVTIFDDISFLWFAECGTRKMKSSLTEAFDGDEYLVSELYIIKKLDKYSIAVKKPWWHDCYYKYE